jgi:hypothetical protein
VRLRESEYLVIFAAGAALGRMMLCAARLFVAALLGGLALRLLKFLRGLALSFGLFLRVLLLLFGCALGFLAVFSDAAVFALGSGGDGG